MANLQYAGLIGCGDFLRWLIDDLNNSKKIKVKYTYDLNPEKSKLRADQLNASVAKSAEQIFNDPEITTVYIFTPPFAREELFKMAVDHRKNIITTKPFAVNYDAAKKLYNMVKGKVECGVFYGRAGNATVETLKTIFDSGEIGHLAIYKEDWFHHYPTWNDWAIQPEKNGGPFMDAMIHNLNRSRYLIGDKVKSVEFFSANYAQKLPCNDTETMRVEFENGASSFLFITWAADLEIFNPGANEREHIGLNHMITSQGWFVTIHEDEDRPVIRAKKNKETKEWPIKPLLLTPYDDFVDRVEKGLPQNHSIEMAMEDMRIMQ